LEYKYDGWVFFVINKYRPQVKSLPLEGKVDFAKRKTDEVLLSLPQDRGRGTTQWWMRMK
jgi:hypothetical protein